MHFVSLNLRVNVLPISVNGKVWGGRKGTSDLIAIGHGDILFIELKRPKGKQSPEQVVFQKEMVSRGFNYVVVRSLEDIEKVIEYSNMGEE